MLLSCGFSPSGHLLSFLTSFTTTVQLEQFLYSRSLTFLDYWIKPHEVEEVILSLKMPS